MIELHRQSAWRFAGCRWIRFLFWLVSLYHCRRIPCVGKRFWSRNHHFAVFQDIDWWNETHRWWTLLIDENYKAIKLGLKVCLQFSRSSLPPNTRIISPIRIIIYRTDTFVYLNILKEHISCYYFAMFFSSLCLSSATYLSPARLKQGCCFLAAQKLFPMIDYIHTTYYHINQKPMRQCFYTAIQDL